MNGQKLYLLLGILVFFSCETTKNTDTSVSSRIIRLYENNCQSRLELRKSIVLDENKFKIGKIYPYAVVSPQKNLYLLDMQNQIYTKFSNDGKFIGIVGNKGKGPGEFTDPSYLFVDDLENTYIFDMSKFALIIHSKDNELVQEITFDNGNPVPGSFKLQKNRRVICLFDPQGESYFKNVDLFHLLDNRFKVIKSINIDYPSVYEQFELGNYLIVKWDMNSDYMFVIFPAVFNVYKYDFDGNLIEIFELEQEAYRPVNQKIGRIIDPIKKIKILARYSQTLGVYLFDSNKLFVSFYNNKTPSNEVVDLNNITNNRNFYYQVVTTNGKQIKARESLLPGLPLYCSPDGMVYILLNDEPGNRKIGVYEIVLEEI
jgi:hypothetical protein